MYKKSLLLVSSGLILSAFFGLSIDKKETKALAAGQTFTKVTESLSDWSGSYLIVYEASETSAYVFTNKGTIDTASNYTELAISNNQIVSSESLDNCIFTFDKMNDGYSISIGGKYISGTSRSNKLNSSNVASKNTIKYDDSSIDIESNTSHLRFNNAKDQLRFRYFKSSSYSAQQKIQLYRLDETPKVSLTLDTKGGVLSDTYVKPSDVEVGSTLTGNLPLSSDVTSPYGEKIELVSWVNGNEIKNPGDPISITESTEYVAKYAQKNETILTMEEAIAICEKVGPTKTDFECVLTGEVKSIEETTMVLVSNDKELTVTLPEPTTAIQVGNYVTITGKLLNDGINRLVDLTSCEVEQMIVISSSSNEVYEGEEISLSYNVSGIENPEVVWNLVDEGNAEIINKDGNYVLKGVKAGSVLLTASCGEVESNLLEIMVKSAAPYDVISGYNYVTYSSLIFDYEVTTTTGRINGSTEDQNIKKLDVGTNDVNQFMDAFSNPECIESIDAHKGDATNEVYLNKDGYINIYGNNATYDDYSYVAFNAKEGYTITSVDITYNDEAKNAVNTNALVRSTIEGEDILSTDNNGTKSYQINGDKVIVLNGNLDGKRIAFSKIVFHYKYDGAKEQISLKSCGLNLQAMINTDVLTKYSSQITEVGFIYNIDNGVDTIHEVTLSLDDFVSKENNESWISKTIEGISLDDRSSQIIVEFYIKLDGVSKDLVFETFSYSIDEMVSTYSAMDNLTSEQEKIIATYQETYLSNN